jgi:hypothetical protein
MAVGEQGKREQAVTDAAVAGFDETKDHRFRDIVLEPLS